MRIGITGLGVVSPIGVGLKDYYFSLRHSISGFRYVTIGGISTRAGVVTSRCGQCQQLGYTRREKGEGDIALNGSLFFPAIGIKLDFPSESVIIHDFFSEAVLK